MLYNKFNEEKVVEKNNKNNNSIYNIREDIIKELEEKGLNKNVTLYKSYVHMFNVMIKKDVELKKDVKESEEVKFIKEYVKRKFSGDVKIVYQEDELEEEIAKFFKKDKKKEIVFIDVRTGGIKLTIRLMLVEKIDNRRGIVFEPFIYNAEDENPYIIKFLYLEDNGRDVRWFYNDAVKDKEMEEKFVKGDKNSKLYYLYENKLKINYNELYRILIKKIFG